MCSLRPHDPSSNNDLWNKVMAEQEQSVEYYREFTGKRCPRDAFGGLFGEVILKDGRKESIHPTSSVWWDDEYVAFYRADVQSPTPDAVNADKALEDQDHDDKLWQVLDDVQRALGKGVNGRALAISALRTHFPAPGKAVAFVCKADMDMLMSSPGGLDLSISPVPRPDLGMNLPLFTATPAPDKALMPEAVIWTDREREAIAALSESQNLSEHSVLRQGLRLYQLHCARFADGETVSWSGDEQRAKDFAGPLYATPTPVEEPEKGATGAITQADRTAAADLLDELSSLMDHIGIGQVADLIRDGEYDEHEATIAFMAHRKAALAATNAGQVEAGYRTELERIAEQVGEPDAFAAWEAIDFIVRERDVLRKAMYDVVKCTGGSHAVSIAHKAIAALKANGDAS